MDRSRATIAWLWLALAATGCSTLPNGPHEVVVPTAPAIEPTVAIAENDASPPSQNDVWSQIRAGLQYSAESDARIDAAVTWFTHHPQLITGLEADAQRYYGYVVAEVARRGMPMEVALLPIIESTLNPFALSRRGASGMWQLMPDTASHYGVAIDWWYDGRRDPIDSTRAALDHLSYLNAFFSGDWLLAMAAYNCGEGCIARAQTKAAKQQPQASGDPSFWELDLAAETADYVPRILALARIIEDPQAYGIDLPVIAPTPAFASADLDRQVDLVEVARLTSLDHEALFRLNPGLNRKATPPDGPHRLLLPVDLAADFAEVMTHYSTPDARWSRYVVKRGDTLADIARRHRTTVTAIRSCNAMRSSTIYEGDALVLPEDGANAIAGNPLVAQSGGATRAYRITAGDSLGSISRRFATSVAQLTALNPSVRDARLKAGETLRVPAQHGRSVEAAARKYRVKPGDSLWQIASRFNVTVQQIARWNGIEATSTLLPGVQLSVEN